MRLLTVLFSSALLLGCHAIQPREVSPLVHQSASANRLLPYFSQISIRGGANVNIVNGKKPSVHLSGNAMDVLQTQTKITQGQLQVIPVSKHGPMTLTIVVPTLTYFDYQGGGYINATLNQKIPMVVRLKNPGVSRFKGKMNIHQLIVKGDGTVLLSGVNSPFMTVALRGNPNIKMEGVVNLQELTIGGSGKFSLYWVKSPLFRLKAYGNAHVQLAGNVHKLDVVLWHHAVLNARYLNAKSTFVQTNDVSTAQLLTTEYQHTLAKDRSNIYFYHMPKGKTDFMDENGAVLRLTP